MRTLHVFHTESHHGLPLVFPICPNLHALPKSINTNISGLHQAYIPRWRGEDWQQVSVSRELKKVRNYMARGLKTNYLPFMLPIAFVESRLQSMKARV